MRINLHSFRILFLIYSFFIGIQVTAQKIDNVEITYKSYVKFDNSNNNEFDKALEKAGKKKSYYKLKCSNNLSSFEYINKIDNSQEDESGLTISISAPFKLYKNFNSKISLMELEAFGEKYLLKDSITTINWKVTRENNEILGHKVRKATAKIDSITTVIAWYAPKIPFPNGPEYFQGLPGLILELAIFKEYESKEIAIYKAIEIFLNDDFKIEKPKKGKIIWKDTFLAEQNKYLRKMKEMQTSGVDASD